MRTIEDVLRDQLGKIVFTNCVLIHQLEEAQEEIKRLQAELKAKETPTP